MKKNDTLLFWIERTQGFGKGENPKFEIHCQPELKRAIFGYFMGSDIMGKLMETILSIANKWEEKDHAADAEANKQPNDD